MKTICFKCKCEMQLVRKTVTHQLMKKEITVHNVPMYVCNTCNNSFYIMDKKLEKCLDEAYMQNKHEINFEG